MRKIFKKLAVSGLTLTLLLTGCSGGEQGASSNEKKPGKIENVPERFANGEEVKVKVIRKIGGDDHTAQFLAGAKKEGEDLGFKVDVFTANGDTAKFHDAIEQAANQDYDGVVISHGDDAATVDAVKKLREKGKSVVTFDSVEDLKSVDGVTLTSQDDKALATLSLDQLVKDFNGKAKIAYLWVDGFPPMVRRNAVYEETLKKNSGIKEVERFGVAAADTSVQTQNAVQAMLKKYPKGKLDAIYATWDAFAIGAARAIKEAGRDEVKIYGIDVSNADLQLMQEKGSSWKYTAAVDPALIGKIDMRILAKKLAGEETPQEYALDASLISQKELSSSKEPVNMESLKNVVPNWGKSDEFEEEWMKTLKEHY
ncbi:sugar ABC transporter substrate-binding protein [Bacillus sp. PK3_68]|uniref:sugar ABC transporter substrate-binding protein n=1 Tax=Bacillus sp. PK3_68 TaxID=2027408 RepID=UPI000E73B39F|nr:sugar ABC transporter substrate-binding protein [Bacillus sp. PK3_68]RJS61468.1 sugar ABC transporter substrate-binding protein [Bacillus sp. PK3_68]